MGVLAVELNDAGIRAARSTAARLLLLDDGEASSPGYARIGRRELDTGRVAARQAFREPLAVDSRFWDRLDTEPALPRRHRSPNRAEVACAHLGRVVETVRVPDDEIVIAVPPFYAERELGILVGIARDLELPLVGLVPSPLVGVPGSSEGAVDSGPLVVVELGLHRGALSVVETGERLSLADTRLCPEAGLIGFRRQWVKAISREFIRQTRFDPLHDAATEQALHDALSGLLDTVAATGRHELEISAGGLAHRVTVTESMLAEAGHSLMFALCGAVQTLSSSVSPGAILLAEDAARVPGLVRMIAQQTSASVKTLDPGAAALGLARSWPECFAIPDGDAAEPSAPRGGVPYHTWCYAGPRTG